MGVLDLEPSQEQPADPSLQDDDIQIESDGNRLAKNAVCPISGKAVRDLNTQEQHILLILLLGLV